MAYREKRYILRSLFSPGSHKFWKLKTDCARLVYLSLIVHADDNGVVECDHQAVMAMTPRSQWTVNDRSSAVRALVKSGLGTTYRQDGKLYMRITGFEQSQSGQVVITEVPKISGPPVSIVIPPIPTNVPSKPKILSRQESFCDSQKTEDCERFFVEARRVFRRIVGKSLGSFSSRSHEWSGLVRRSGGGDVVVQAVELWARENTAFLKEARFPLAHFLKNSSEYVEAAKIPVVVESGAQAPPSAENDWNMPTVEDDLPPDFAEVQKRLKEERERKAASA